MENWKDSDSSGAGSTVDPLFSDYDEQSWFDSDSGVASPVHGDPVAQTLNLLTKPEAMGNLETLLRFI
ncbi:unnamed protein product [Dracunculus medinensis]|uniref:ICA69 domain-containing protein n=1 Tax=Dracunculus medinensis TaxID=318479 RepID=A0A0N4UP36_DRAME|nr:unnamed protein product [Dracunculus medinensis]